MPIANAVEYGDAFFGQAAGFGGLLAAAASCARPLVLRGFGGCLSDGGHGLGAEILPVAMPGLLGMQPAVVRAYVALVAQYHPELLPAETEPLPEP